MKLLHVYKYFGSERDRAQESGVFEKVLLNCLIMEKLTIDQVTSLLREHALPEVLLDTLSGKFPRD